MIGQLLSVNVGLPRDITWRGQTVHTAIWKMPVEGSPRRPRRPRRRTPGGICLSDGFLSILAEPIWTKRFHLGTIRREFYR
jgi:hypothetical protein